jgi:hypothetical protein
MAEDLLAASVVLLKKLSEMTESRDRWRSNAENWERRAKRAEAEIAALEVLVFQRARAALKGSGK